MTAARSTLRLYRNNRNGTFTDVTRAAGLDVELYGMGVAVGDFDNDGFPDSVHHLRRPEPPVPQHRQGHLRRRDAHERPRRRAGVQHLGAVGSTSIATACSISSSATTSAGRRDTTSSAARRPAEVVLHARGLSRRDLLAVPQPRRRQLRGRHGDLRHLRLELEGARRRADRRRPGRLAGSLRRQRHAAEQALSQPAQRHVPATSRCGRCRAQRGREGAGGDGRGRGRLRQLGPRPAWP